MDDNTKEKFIENYIQSDEKIVSKIELELKKRKEQHYYILKSDN